jgi:N-acetylneuraminic acid mutarotase
MFFKNESSLHLSKNDLKQFRLLFFLPPSSNARNPFKVFISRVLFLILTLFLVILGNDKAFAQWVTLEPIPSERVASGYAVFDSKIYVFGGGIGSGGNTPTNTVFIYDPSTNTWTTGADMPGIRTTPTAATFNNKIYVIGGFESAATDVVFEYDPSADTWTTKTSMPTARLQLSLNSPVISSKIYVVGGDADGSTDLATNEVYDPAADSWSTKASMANARGELCTAAVNGKIYAIGGFPNTASGFVEQYDPDTDTWTTKTKMPTGRFRIECAVLGNNIYVAGGVTSGSVTVDTVDVYDASTDTWSTTTSLPATASFSMVAVVSNTLYVIGGFNTNNGNPVATTYGLDIGDTRTVAFDATTSSGTESTTSVTIPVSLSASSVSTITVDYAVTGGTATGSDTDFTLANGTLTFAAGTTTQNISITVVSDSISESDETIIITLSNPSNSNLGTNTTHTYTITDSSSGSVAGTYENSALVVSPYWQSDSESYTFIAVSHASLSGMASQIGVIVNTIQSNQSTFASAQTFTVESGTTRRMFIVRTNHPTINASSVPDAEFIIGTTNFSHGHLRINPVATSPTTSTGTSTLTGDGFRDSTMLSYWGAVVVETNTTGFAMEFIGDMHDSSSAPDFSCANPVSGPGAP